MVLATDKQFENGTTMIDKNELEYDGKSHTMNFNFVKFSEHGNCFAPTDPCQSHAKLPALHLFSQYVAHSARRAVSPMGSIGPLRALDGGGKGPSARTGGGAPRASGTVVAALVKLARTA